MNRPLSDEFNVAQKQLALITSVSELQILDGLVRDRLHVVSTAPPDRDQLVRDAMAAHGFKEVGDTLQFVRANSKAAEPEPQPTTREEILKFIVQTEGAEQLQELATAIGEIGPSEHEQAMELMNLVHPAVRPTDANNHVDFVIKTYRMCRAAVAECNAAG